MVACAFRAEKVRGRAGRRKYTSKSLAAVYLVFKQSKTLVYHLSVQKIFLQNRHGSSPKTSTLDRFNATPN